MRKGRSTKFSRRVFTSGALAGGAASVLTGAGERQITQASVPGDPDAPRPQKGTLPETLPFSKPLVFARQDVAIKAEPVPMEDVRLLPGPFADAQEANRKLMHRLPVDRLVHTFRLNAGLHSNAEPLGGWEKPDCELRGHFVGHFLSACALLYASTGDADAKSKGDKIVAELAECQQKLGGRYLSAFPLEFFDRLRKRQKVWAPFYTVHKIMAGMLDMHSYCGNSQALTVLRGMADWADQWTSELTDAQMQMVLDTEYGGMNDVLYNLAVVTKEPRYARVGDRFTKVRFFNPLALRRDELRGLHTNTHIPQVIGAARRFEISGDQRFHDVADYFWREVTETRTYVTAGTSNNEGWLVDPNALAQEMAISSETNECCCAYNMLKLSRMLYTWTADPRYFDYYERALYNHRLGTISLDDGTTQYFLSVVPGSWRTFGTEFTSFWCCNGTGLEEYAKLNDSIYFHSGDSIYINLFISSQLVWRHQGVRIRQTSKIPESSSTEISIEIDQPKRFAVHLRIPSWVAGFPTVKLNGVGADVSGRPGGYVTVLRTWNNGDRIELELPMKVYSEAMADNHSVQALLFGPLVLAAHVSGEEMGPDLTSGKMGPDLDKVPSVSMPSIPTNGKSVDQLVKTASKPLTFTIPTARGQLELLPLNKVTAGRRYSIYWKAI